MELISQHHSGAWSSDRTLQCKSGKRR